MYLREYTEVAILFIALAILDNTSHPGYWITLTISTWLLDHTYFHTCYQPIDFVL